MRSIINKIRQSLSLKLSITVVLLTVPVFVITQGFIFQQSRQGIKEHALKRATSSLNTTTLSIIRLLNLVEDATNINAWLIAERFSPDSLLTMTRLIVQMNPMLRGCAIATESDMFPAYGHRFIARSERQSDSIATTWHNEWDHYQSVWYTKTMLAGHAGWTAPIGSDDGDAPHATGHALPVSYCRPLYDTHRRFLGVIASDLDLASIAHAITDDKPFPNAYFVLLGPQGHYFVHPDSTRIITQTVFTQTNINEHPDIIALGHEMTNGKTGAMRAFIKGEPCLVCYRPVPGTDWSIALVSPESDILKSHRLLTVIILPIIIIGLIVIFLLSHQIVTRSVIPLRRLLRQSQLIADGQYDIKITHSSRSDAVGRLQNSFAAMQQSLDSYVTDIQRMNHESEQRNKELKEARKMAEEGTRQKTVFMQNITHQIRTPLNILMGFTQLMRDCDAFRQLPSDETSSIIDTMSHNSGLLKRMVLMLYDSSDTGLSEEMQAHANEEVNINELARKCVEYNIAHNMGISIKIESELPDTFVITSNLVYMARTVGELLYNAAKYSDGKNILLHISKTDTSVVFAVQDSGPGIYGDNRERMFQPFSKLDDLTEGLGLGLPLAKRHALTLGGDLTLDESYHGGCRFVFTVPITPPKQGSASI